MKKINIFSLAIALLWIPLPARPEAHHKYAKNKYSQILGCEYPLNHDVPKYFRSADKQRT